MPKDAWGPLYVAHNHFSTVTVCPNGDVLAVWYTTVSEGGREGSLAASRLRVGSKRWDPASLFFAIPDCNINAGVLLSDGQRLYHFFAQSLKSWTQAAVCMRISEDSGATWSKPRIILSRDHPQNMNQTCSGFVAKDGTLVLAADGSGRQLVLTSRDRGKTWKVGQGNLRKAAGKRVVHPALVETGDGNILAFLRGPNPMPSFLSQDMGKSWEPRPTPFPGIAIGQKAAALRLKSGAILLVSFNNHWSKKNGKIRLRGGGVYAALSLDDGKTWPHARKIDNLTGYMSVAQAPNGAIYHFGSRMRG